MSASIKRPPQEGRKMQSKPKSTRAKREAAIRQIWADAAIERRAALDGIMTRTMDRLAKVVPHGRVRPFAKKFAAVWNVPETIR